MRRQLAEYDRGTLSKWQLRYCFLLVAAEYVWCGPSLCGDWSSRASLSGDWPSRAAELESAIEWGTLAIGFFNA
eukprot:8417024-Pyramimonas_sp.AAC.1